jgi:endonuclease YncB( thermonuclease family)
MSRLFVINDSYARRGGGSSGYKPYKGAKAIDGDTFKYGSKSYRLRDYDAPEIGQHGSKKATKDLQKRLDSGNYEYDPVAKDVYGRTIVKEKAKK